MNRFASLTLALTLAGCCTPGDLAEPDPTGTPTDALLLADPGSVSNSHLDATAAAIGVHHKTFSMYEGVSWEPRYDDPVSAQPTGYGKGGDAALFTGYALAMHAFRYGATSEPEALELALTSLRGVYYLTHIGGKGVIARCAFPTADSVQWDYPDRWHSRLEERVVFVDQTDVAMDGPALPPPHNDAFRPSTYYTRATRDQLTGLIFGLSVSWELLPITRDAVLTIVANLYDRLDDDHWFIRNRDGKNNTNADDVDGLLKSALLGLYTKASGDPDIQTLYEDTFTTGGLGDYFNWGNNANQYYAHNLRAARSFGLWILETNPERKAELAEYYLDHVWEHTQGHQAAWFAYIAAVLGDGSAAAEGRASLASLSFRPLRLWKSPYGGQTYPGPSYLCALLRKTVPYVLAPHLRKPTDNYLWTKEPWGVDSAASDPTKPPEDATLGLSYLLPYWLARYYGQLSGS